MMFGDVVMGSIERPEGGSLSRAEAVALSRSVLLRLDDANRTGNLNSNRDRMEMYSLPSPANELDNVGKKMPN